MKIKDTFMLVTGAFLGAFALQLVPAMMSPQSAHAAAASSGTTGMVVTEDQNQTSATSRSGIIVVNDSVNRKVVAVSYYHYALANSPGSPTSTFTENLVLSTNQSFNY